MYVWGRTGQHRIRWHGNAVRSGPHDVIPCLGDAMTLLLATGIVCLVWRLNVSIALCRCFWVASRSNWDSRRITWSSTGRKKSSRASNIDVQLIATAECFSLYIYLYIYNTSWTDPSPSALILVPCCQPVEPDREGPHFRNHAAIPVVDVRERAVSRHVDHKDYSVPLDGLHIFPSSEHMTDNTRKD